MERIGHIIHSEVNIINWKPIQLSQNGAHLSIFLFADDIVLCAEASIEQARIFCKASGQKVNIQKSNIFFSKKVSGHEAKEIAQVIGISSTTDLGRYFGAPSINGCV